MVIAGISLIGIIAILVWLRTGLSPFIWMSRGALHLEAIRIQAWASIAVAWRHFRSEYQGTLEMVKALEGQR